MKKRYLLQVAALFIFSNILVGQKMSITSYHDGSIPRVEPNPSHYKFIYPIQKDLYSLPTFNPPVDGKFLGQNYGPRYVGNFDNHQGMDIWSSSTFNGITNAHPPTLSMCDGTIRYLFDGPDSIVETTISGRTIRVECDSNSLVFNSPIHFYYRHLDSIVNTVSVGMAINKGDTIAFAGSSGTTNFNHLHLDYSGVPNTWGNITNRKYLNPMRLFDPDLNPEVIGKLDYAHIEILYDWPDSTLIRVLWPNEQHINRFEFSNASYNLIYDMEEVRASYPVYEPSIWAVDSMLIFPYRYNDSTTPLDYWNTVDYPALMPASINRDTNVANYGFFHIPILVDSVSHLYDFMLHHVPFTHNTKDWVVKLSDVWGNVVEGVTDCSNTVTSSSNWGAGSLRAAINCAEPNDTISFDIRLNNTILETDLPVISIDKTLFFQANANQNITISNKSDLNTAALLLMVIF